MTLQGSADFFFSYRWNLRPLSFSLSLFCRLFTPAWRNDDSIFIVVSAWGKLKPEADEDQAFGLLKRMKQAVNDVKFRVETAPHSASTEAKRDVFNSAREKLPPIIHSLNRELLLQSRPFNRTEQINLTNLFGAKRCRQKFKFSRHIRVTNWRPPWIFCSGPFLRTDRLFSSLPPFLASSTFCVGLR